MRVGPESPVGPPISANPTRKRGRLGLAALCVLLAACKPAVDRGGADDFTVLAQSAGGFAQARPGRPLVFPRDHGAHPDFRIEWWYLTANLEDASGRPYGAQWTLFRIAGASGIEAGEGNAWQDPQVYMAHLGVTTPTGHNAFQRYARGGDHDGLVRAGATAEPFAAWLDDWALKSIGPGWLPLEVQASQDRWGLRLRLDSDRPPLPQGLDGFSQKHPDGGGSHYYSQPWLKAGGELEIDGEHVAVSGQAWLDREWSSQFLRPDQVGWDWFALHLDSGEKLMLYRLRGRDSGTDFRHGVLLAPDGGRTLLDPERIRLQVAGHEMAGGRRLPLRWRIELPQLGRAMEVEALHPQQWMDVDFAYWEGVVQVAGEGAGNTGRGYLELTGYPALP